ncbi:hypothetical protein DFS34DRAFT_613016 [Phlyctochytrium arcticum]|nr:hypothetical protein DFS34DRAFT_613016 [Phlyctochytrium arcticum]
MPPKTAKRNDGGRYASQIRRMKEKLLALVQESTKNDGWDEVASVVNPRITVYKLQNTDFCIKVVADLNCTPETAFDTLADITRRGQWDELCEESGIIEEVDPATKVQFMKTKGVWPASPRDALVLAHIERLEDGRLMNVAQSVSHPDYPSRDIEGIVRMETKISGQIVGPCPGNETGMCRVIQVADGDLKGWIPKSVIAAVGTKSMPNSFKALDRLLITVEGQPTSLLLDAAEQVVSPPSVVESISMSPAPSQVSLHTAPSRLMKVPSSKAPTVRRSLLSRVNSLLSLTSTYMVVILFALKMHKLWTRRKLLSYNRAE